MMRRTRGHSARFRACAGWFELKANDEITPKSPFYSVEAVFNALIVFILHLDENRGAHARA